MRAIMLAAGLGERLRPHTLNIAKPAIPFLNVPLMGFPMFHLERAGLKHLVVNTHHLPETVESAARRLCAGRFQLDFSPEPAKILGSGGGIAKAASFFPNAEDFLVANADTLCFFSESDPMRRLMHSIQSGNAIAALMLSRFPKQNENFGGVYVDQSNHVRKFSKQQLNEPGLTAYHFTGFMAVRGSFAVTLKPEPSNFLYDILQPQIEGGEEVLAVIDEGAQFFETGNTEDYLAATESCLKQIQSNAALAATLSRYSPGWDNFKTGVCYSVAKPPAQLKGEQPALFGRGARIDGTLGIDGFAVLGDGCRIGTNVRLHRSVIGNAVEIADHSQIENQLII